MRVFLTSRAKRPRLAAGLVVGSLVTGLLTIPAAAANAAPATGPDPNRVKVLAAWQAGGPAVRWAAETALTGSAENLKAFLAGGQTAAADQDLRARVEELIAASGRGVREAGTAALAGSASDLQDFLNQGFRKPYEDDQRVRLSQIMVVGGPGVQDAAGKALDGSIDDVNLFLNEVQFKARDDDDRVRLAKLMVAGGPEVKKAAGAALDGTMDDVQQFLQYGYQTAAAHDQETLTVSQLADLTKNASTQAGQQTQVARDAAGKALDSTRLAKEAAERAAAETKAAQGSAGQASNAAARAADAADRAAAAAQTASTAAKAANEASRQAANAAASAAAAATKAGNAAARALSAAAAAAGDAGKAEDARAAAVTARQAAVDARTAGEASVWAAAAATQSIVSAQAAASAGANAAAAAQAAADSATYQGVSAAAANRARQAAAKAKTAAAEATRAANATTKIANDAAAAAGDAQRAANDAAAHADAAAAAADEAAQHAGNASSWANTAQTAATAAGAAADSAAASATQAHKVADIARASDQERLDAQQATEMAAADEASREADQKAKTAAWEAGKATQLTADTEQLIKDATATGTDPKTALLKGRQAALRLLDVAGPWTKAAAQTALEGDDSAVQAFLNTGLTVARDRDDRTSVMAIAQAPGKMEKRLAAETASVGTPDQVRAFLATGQYPGKDDDDRILLAKIMIAGGPGVKDAAGKALDGTIDDVHAFLATGQYKARDDDNRVLVTKAMINGGPEVKAAVQAVLSGPADRLEPFLQTGLPKAQQRDAVTAAHVATIQSYLATIDGSVALARQYAAEASQSYATAQGAADQAAGYANQAHTSATQAADWSNKAAESANQAQTSATQASGYAKQAQTSAASANTAASRASASAAMATGYAATARQYAATAKNAADQAQASAAAANKSADEAAKAAAEAQEAVWKKQQAEATAAQVPSGTAGNEGNGGNGGNGGGRAYYVETVPRNDVKPDVIRDDMGRCDKGESGTLADWFTDSNWHKNATGVEVCEVTLTVKVTGTVDYIMRTCPEAGLSPEACKGKYTVWDTLVLNSQQLDKVEYTTRIEMTRESFKKYHVSCPRGVCGSQTANMFTLLAGDFIQCFNNPGPSCGWAAATLIPYGKLAQAAKGIVAFRFALETGVGIEDAKLALQATLNGYSQATLNSLTSVADAITAFRSTLKDGVGTDAALAALRNNPAVDRALIREFEHDSDLAARARKGCPTRNSFPAGTPVLMADGSQRPIDLVNTDDSVIATDPISGITAPEQVTARIYTPNDQDFTEIHLGESSVTATDHHSIWSESRRSWIDARDLATGETVRSANGDSISIGEVHQFSQGQAAYNLTVANLHSYYVMAGSASMLVHNSDCREYYEYHPSGTGIMAEVGSDGMLDTIVSVAKNAPSTDPTGGQMFINAMEAVGHNADGVRGKWLSGGELKDNLDSFNAGIQNLLSPEDAARNTFTGKMAARYGFTEVEFEIRIGSPGEYAKVQVLFKRPKG
ncbi:polymorphic toxin-type HINT domain-containing protein [Kitasatospora sp. NPDC050543]|uniref:polymorphic toxin-type HINT domain-containing protein n=1 Tax=Kitasatospora sp. NPDC050543 TaxID=3364054 RepID=UPI0037914974